MRHMLAAACAALIFCSCSNLFHYEVEPDVVPPIEPPAEELKVDHVVPENNAVQVDRNAGILVFFSSALDETTVTDETVVVEKIDETNSDGKIIKVKTSVMGDLAVINTGTGVVSFMLPENSSFEAQKTYCITIKRGIRGLDETVLQKDFESAFTTGGVIDDPPDEPPAEQPLNIEQVIPTNNSVGIVQNTGIFIVFPCEIDKTTVSNEKVVVEKIEDTEVDGEKTEVRTTIDGNVKVENNVRGFIVFTLPENVLFDAQEIYGVTIKRGIRGLQNRVLQNDFQSRFTTGGTADRTPPKLVSVSPNILANTDNIINEIEIEVTFSEPINTVYLQNTKITFSNLTDSDDFKSIVFSRNDFDIDLLEPNSIHVTAKFNTGLVPPGKYQVVLDRASDIRDMAGNQYSGEVRKEIIYYECFEHPSLTRCFTETEGAECSD